MNSIVATENKVTAVSEQLLTDVRERVLENLRLMGLEVHNHSSNGRFATKEEIRHLHAEQRKACGLRELSFVRAKASRLLRWFAEGVDVDVEKIRPQLVPVESESNMGDLFRLATLLWSVPVSRGFGRRMRFLVIDQSNEKLIGLFALGDPVFNLHVRDQWIGWGVRDREERLVNVMDAYVLGAVPPYSQLLGGKLVASMIGSSEVSNLFDQRYGMKRGIISGQLKSARLVLVTTTSALGRSSLYNRLKIPDVLEYQRLGITSGYGHFHMSDEIFETLRQLLELEGHKYASGHQYGDGPNWKFRVLRVGLQRVGLDPEILRHGIEREVYGIPLSDNWREYLNGRSTIVTIERPCAAEIGEYCLDRWVIPRALRKPDFRHWTREQTWQQILSNSALPIQEVVMNPPSLL